MAWRVLFFLGGVLILTGGPRHPRGTMVQMLAHPDWLMAHVLVTLGFGAMLAGLVLFGRQRAAAGPLLARWTRIAIVLTALQTFEAVMHTVSMVDAEALAAGASTPVLTTHLTLAVIIYPLFAIAAIGFIIAAMRERAAGSPWIAWLGILGAAAHGLSAPLVIALGIPGAGILFPMVMGLALWLVLAAIWPSSALRPSEGKPRVATQA